MNPETHSLADWVRLRGGIKISEITHDNTEIRAVCSRAEAGYNLLNSKRGKHLDELTGDAIVEGWIGPMSDHDDFLMLLGNDIQAKRSGNDLARVWHYSRDLDDLLDKVTHGADVDPEEGTMSWRDDLFTSRSETLKEIADRKGWPVEEIPSSPVKWSDLDGLPVVGCEVVNFDDWADWCGDCCSSCGLSPEEARRIGKPEPDEVWLCVPETGPNSVWLNFDWHDILCDECCNMIVKVMP